MVLSRAAYGVRGNRLPSFISWLLCVGWETVLSVIAVLATSTVFTRLGWGGGDGVKAIAMIIIAALIIGGGVMGFDLIMRMQAVITVITGVLTVFFIVLTFKHVSWHVVSHVHSGTAQSLIGALVFVMTGFGLGWVNAAADYSRYLPRKASTSGVVWWTTFGSSIAPVILVFFGLLLAGSSTTLSSAIGNDPVGALATLLPTWFLVPFVIVAVLGLVGGAVLDIYSSGLSLLSAGLRIPRYAAAGVDGVVMVVGTVYIVFFAHNFLPQFEGFLITVGVLIAAWCGVFLGGPGAAKEGLLRRRPLPQRRPIRRHSTDTRRDHDRHQCHRMGTGDQHRRVVVDVAGLPPGPDPPRRQIGELGLRQPRRLRGVGAEFPRHRRFHRRPSPPARGPRRRAGDGRLRRRRRASGDRGRRDALIVAVVSSNENSRNATWLDMNPA